MEPSGGVFVVYEMIKGRIGKLFATKAAAKQIKWNKLRNCNPNAHYTQHVVAYPYPGECGLSNVTAALPAARSLATLECLSTTLKSNGKGVEQEEGIH